MLCALAIFWEAYLSFSQMPRNAVVTCTKRLKGRYLTIQRVPTTAHDIREIVVQEEPTVTLNSELQGM